MKTTAPEPSLPSKNKAIGSPAVPSNGVPDTQKVSVITNDGSVKVNVAVAVCVPLVAVTVHVPAERKAVSDVPDAVEDAPDAVSDTSHPVVVVLYLTGSVPVPPALVRAIGVPSTAVAGVPIIVNDDDAAVKVNEAVPVFSPWVAVTTHVPAAVAVSDESVTTHSVLAALYLTGSVPVPPALVRAIGVPTAAVVGVPDTVNGYEIVMGLAKVTVAVPVCDPWVAVTVHVPAAVAVSDESETLHPALVVS